jgi:hypothetical protein
LWARGNDLHTGENVTISILEVQEQYEAYNSFAIGLPDTIRQRFIPEAVYYQVETNRTALGYEEIYWALAAWKQYLKNLRLEVRGVRAQPRPIGRLDGAVQCFLVDFIVSGRYELEMSGLGVPAHNGHVRIRIGETVWFNAEGKITRIESSLNVADLRMG